MNYFGYETEKMTEIKIRDIMYTGEVTNNYMSFDVIGVPPSINKLMSLSQKLLEKDDTSADVKSE